MTSTRHADGTFHVEHNAPTHRAQLTQLGDEAVYLGGEPFVASDTTHPDETRPKGPAIDEPVLSDAGLGQILGGHPPATFPLPEKNILQTPEFSNGEEPLQVGPAVPIMGATETTEGEQHVEGTGGGDDGVGVDGLVAGSGPVGAVDGTAGVDHGVDGSPADRGRSDVGGVGGGDGVPLGGEVPAGPRDDAAG